MNEGPQGHLGASSSIVQARLGAFALAASVLFVLVVAEGASAHRLSWLKADGIAGRVAEQLAVQDGFNREDSFPACRRQSDHSFACKLRYWGFDPNAGPHGANVDCVRAARVFYPNATTRTARIHLASTVRCHYDYVF